jgi:hypothetical protein
MIQSVRTMRFIAFAAAVAAILTALIIPGCMQNQDNSPISVSTSGGRTTLSLACSTDGSVAYVADGRNIYRYERRAAGAAAWECILSQGERLEMAVRHDPREQQEPAPVSQKPGEKSVAGKAK